MSPRTAARIGWSLCVVSTLLVAISIVFSILNRDVPDQGDYSLAFDVDLRHRAACVPGRRRADRRTPPANLIGWLFCVVGIPFGISGVAYGWGAYGLFADPGALPGADWAAWLGSWLFAPSLFAVPSLLFLLFPDGKPPSPRWRPVAWLVVVGIAAWTVGSALLPGRLTEPPFTGIENPAGVEAAGTAIEVVSVAGFTLLFVGDSARRGRAHCPLPAGARRRAPAAQVVRRGGGDVRARRASSPSLPGSGRATPPASC